MLTIGLISFILAVPIFSYRIPATVFSRITSIILMFSAVLTCNCLYNYPVTYGGIGLYSGLFQVSTITLGFQLLLLITGSMLLFAWGPVIGDNNNTDVVFPANIGNSAIERSVSINSNYVHVNTISEQSLVVLFSVLGGCLLISSFNIVSMYMAIELQSFAAYIMSTLYRNSQSATSAGLKYFLLGSLASGIIVLGTAVIYSGTGVTSYEDLATLISVGNDPNSYVTICIAGGLLLIGIGYIFKVGAAPLYNWAPDVYDGVPSIITSWVSTIPKISILVFLLNLSFIATGYNFTWSNELQETVGNLYTVYAQPFQTLLLVCSVMSFIVGSIVGLSQVRIKRLLTFSTITHVGFMLLALAVSSEESIEGFVFYLTQYTLTNVNVFLTLLAFGYITKGIIIRNNKTDIREFTLLDDLKGQFYKNPLLTISFGLSLFSIAGIPPLVGFFGKQLVLYSVSYNYSYVAIIAIVTSVISASYYLKIVQLMFFSKDSVNTVINSNNENNQNYDDQPLVTTMHSSVISILTLAITFYMLDSSILLNACRLMSLSLFTT
uniref:NADH dehydrogenase subunit 2 n=1 Tax=Malassezia vespertilionis TaxID=2020962 RepID=UPI003001DE41|nr:NADH dehydrogenase subunit 2 [Malassezia vespertilionis]